MFQTELCKTLNIKYPIIQGGMAWISDSQLVAAVSNAGGLGTIGAGNYDDHKLREEIRKTKKLTDKPFCVNIVPLAGAMLIDRINLLLDEGVEMVSTALSDPTSELITKMAQRGIKVISVVPSVSLALRMEEEGASIIVASGDGAGGHTGNIATFPLVPQVVDAVKVPVVAAGGIGDARGFIAALALGACGIQMGTRFITSEECICHSIIKDKILEARDEDTRVTGMITGKPVRCLLNPFITDWIEKEKRQAMSKEEFQKWGMGRYRSAVIDGKWDEGTIACGQICGMIKKIEPVKDIIEEIMKDAETIYQSLPGN